MRRSRWNVFLVDELLSELSRSNRSLREIMYARGYSNSDYVCFVQWLGRRSDRTTMYQAARRAKVLRMQSHLGGLGVEELAARGRRWFRRQAHFIEGQRPLAVRRAEARQHRAARAARDPHAERLLQARRRAKRRGMQKRKEAEEL